jgi:hypothetical protein
MENLEKEREAVGKGTYSGEEKPQQTFRKTTIQAGKQDAKKKMKNQQLKIQVAGKLKNMLMQRSSGFGK